MPDYVKAQNYSIFSSDGEQIPNVGTNLFDGKIDDDNRWSANVFPKTIIIELDEEKDIIGTRLFAYQSRAYQFTIEVSNSPESGFVQVVDRTSNTDSDQPISNDFDLQSGRYVKLTVTGCHDYASSWISINELALIFNDDTSSITNKKENTGFIKVYPNPISSSFNIVTGGIEKAQVQIYNMSGKLLYNALASDDDINMPGGIYLIKVSGNNSKTYYQKLIVE